MSLKASLLISAALLTSCSILAPQGPTEVARGEYYSAGKPAFDSFFIALYELQVELLAAPGALQQARRNLAHAVGLTAEASDESLASRLRQELKKLESQGLRLRLEVPDSPAADASATLHASESAVSSALRSKLPEEATRLVRSRNRMQLTRAQLEKLRVTGIQLETKVDAEFRVAGPWKRDEVRRNLADGQKLITLMQARAQEIEDQDKRLLALVATAATTDPHLGKPAADAPPPEEPTKPGKRGHRPATGGVKPSAPAAAKPSTSAAAKPSAPATAKPAEDGAAPKAVQGTAPAEIEP